MNSGADIALMLEVLDTTCLAEVVELVATWRPTVGGRGTTGMGAATVTALHSGQLDPATPEGMRLLLTRSGPDLVAAVSSTEHRVRPAEAIEVRRYRFRSNGPLLIRGAKDSNGTMALQRSGQFHVDGSSWKGVFRSGCEFAILSAAGARGVEPSLVAVDLLFGTASRRGLLRFEETPLVAARESPRIHVAIDRVTGGASNDRLFTDTPVEGAYAELRITVPYPVPDWVGVLLDAVAADLDDGYLALGGATSRGYGTISVDSSPTATGLGGCLESVLAGEDLATPVPGGFPSGSDA
ncbi:MAG: hypothetical protein KDB16_08200 [Acidimicrobiales bacterium]|nr:hypothetical protein [Acidimicrobiales bacterium]